MTKHFGVFSVHGVHLNSAAKMYSDSARRNCKFSETTMFLN